MNRSESPNIVELAGYLQEAADRYTKLLALDHWKPGRSHMEQARNAFVSASNTLEQAYVVPREWFDELTAQNLSQHEHIRMLEEWIYEIIFSWLVGGIKPEQISRGRSLIENPITPVHQSAPSSRGSLPSGESIPSVTADAGGADTANPVTPAISASPTNPLKD